MKFAYEHLVIDWRVIFFMIFLGSISIMIFPYIGMGILVDEDHIPSLNKLQSIEFKGMLIASIAVTLPLMLDSLLDVFHKIPEVSSVSDFVPNRETFLMITFVDVVILVILLPLNLYAAIVTLIIARDCTLLFIFMKYIQQLVPNIFIKRHMTFITTCFGVGFILDTAIDLTTNAWFMENEKYFYAVIVGIPFIDWIRMLIGFSKEIKKTEKLSSHTVVGQIYSLFCTAFVVYNVVLADLLSELTDDDDWLSFGVHNLTVRVALSCVCILFASVLTNRIVRMESRSIQEALKSRKEFMRYISHEIRTPLNIVLSGLKVLEEDIARNVPQAELTETVLDIRGSCVIAVDTLSEMLTYDKVESKSMALDKTDFAVYSFVTECLRPFYLQATAKGVVLNAKFDDVTGNVQLMMMTGDQHKLSQVFRNVISNALKFTPTNGTVSVNVSLVDHNKVKIAVVDSGPGISEENQKKLFKSIVQFNPGKLQDGGGTGLGLYISKGICELHNGDLTVFSAGEGTGCTFTVLIPLSYENGALEQLNSEDSKKSKKSSSVSRRVPPEHDDSVAKFRHGCSRARKSIVQIEIDRRGDHAQPPISPTNHTVNPHTDSEKIEAKVSVKPVPKPHERRLIRVSLDKPDVHADGPVESDAVMPFSYDGDSSLVPFRDEKVPLEEKCEELRPKVLVVDDSVGNRKMLVRLLRNRCESCDVACDGQEAVELVSRLMDGQRAMYGVILMDNHMPRMDGPTAALAIRSMGYKGLIIGLTGDAAEEDHRQFLSSGADHVLTKPLDVSLYDDIVSRSK